MANLRFEVVADAFNKKAVEVITPVERPSEFFGKNVFNRAKMYKYLPREVYEKLIDVIDNGARLDRSMADAVAKGMKQWADENGVTHYTHWFQPLTEGTAEKHDAFIEHDGKGAHDYAVTMMLYIVYLCYAVAGIVVIVSALQIYIKMNTGEEGVKKNIMMLVGACLFLIGATIVFPAFFGYQI